MPIKYLTTKIKIHTEAGANRTAFVLEEGATQHEKEFRSLEALFFLKKKQYAWFLGRIYIN